MVSVKLIVDVTVFTEHSVVLLKYADGPDQQNGWFIPNSELAAPADLTEAARRILKDQIGLEAQTPEVAKVDSFIGRDGTWHLAVHFKCQLMGEAQLSPGSGVSDIRWCPLTDLPEGAEIAHHGWYLGIIRHATRELA